MIGHHERLFQMSGEMMDRYWIEKNWMKSTSVALTSTAEDLVTSESNRVIFMLKTLVWSITIKLLLNEMSNQILFHNSLICHKHLVLYILNQHFKTR